jgi:hypothetical protein
VKSKNSKIVSVRKKSFSLANKQKSIISLQGGYKYSKYLLSSVLSKKPSKIIRVFQCVPTPKFIDTAKNLDPHALDWYFDHISNNELQSFFDQCIDYKYSNKVDKVLVWVLFKQLQKNDITTKGKNLDDLCKKLEKQAKSSKENEKYQNIVTLMACLKLYREIIKPVDTGQSARKSESPKRGQGSSASTQESTDAKSTISNDNSSTVVSEFSTYTFCDISSQKFGLVCQSSENDHRKSFLVLRRPLVIDERFFSVGGNQNQFIIFFKESDFFQYAQRRMGHQKAIGYSHEHSQEKHAKLDLAKLLNDLTIIKANEVPRSKTPRQSLTKFFGHNPYSHKIDNLVSEISAPQKEGDKSFIKLEGLENKDKKNIKIMHGSNTWLLH